MTRTSAEARREWLAAWLRWTAGPAESRIRAFTLGGVAAALMLGGSFLNFLNYNQYPVASGEAALAVAGILAGSALVGLLAAALGAGGRVVLTVFLAVLAIDLNFDSRALLLLGLVAAVLCARVARQALMLLFGVVIASQAWTALSAGAPLPEQQASASATADFALVHLVLDEHIGLDGIPDSAPGGPELRAQLRDFYVGNGFRVFAGAYSESLRTVHAIPRAFSLEAASAWTKGGRHGTALERNPYFDALQSLGLRIDVTQSDWVDYCGHPAVASCVTRVAGGLVDVGDRLPVSDKAMILIYRFAALSGVAQTILRFYDMLALSGRRAGFDAPVIQLQKRTVTSTLTGMANFDAVIAEARSLAPGKAIFAHVLLPHYPYVYDARCGMRRLRDWLGRASAVSWETRYWNYFEQVACTTRKIEALLAAIASSPAAGRTVFLIHGDHGSRIMRVETNIEHDGKFTGRDLVDGHAALFAVAAPGIQPGYDSVRYPLRLLLHALTRSGFRAIVPALPAGFVPSIALEDRRRNPVVERAVGEVDWWQGRPQDAARTGDVVP